MCLAATQIYILVQEANLISVTSNSRTGTHLGTVFLSSNSLYPKSSSRESKRDFGPVWNYRAYFELKTLWEYVYPEEKKQNPFEMRNEPKKVFLTEDY